MYRATDYTPARWQIIKITDDKGEDLYKVYGTWLGGYLDGDSWRVNSGITNIEEDEEFYIVHGYSGSIYKCGKNNYGTTGYGMNVMYDMIEKAKEINFNIEILSEEDAMEFMKWKN